MPPRLDFHDRRRAAAEREFHSYDFGDAKFTDTSGWEWSVPGDVWTRGIFFEKNEEERLGNPDVTTILGHFSVEFAEGTEDVVTSYAWCGDNDVGHRPTAMVAPAAPLFETEFPDYPAAEMPAAEVRRGRGGAL